MSIPGPASTGRIESLHFARLLARFWGQGFSGSFRAQGQSSHALTVSKEILFERGRVAWAASDDPQESIKTHLLNRGILRPEQWRLAQEKAGSAHPRQTLLEMGFLSARELQDADRERVSGIILSLFNWVEGEYATSAVALPPGTPNLKIDPRDLVLEGIMSSGDRDKVLAEIGSLDAVLVIRPDDLVRASLSLPVELVELMGKADGTRSVAEICALSPLSDFMISAAFAALKILGLAAPARKGAGAAPPAPPRAASPPAPLRRPRRSEPASQLPLMAEAEPGSAGTDTEEARDFLTEPVTATPPEGSVPHARPSPEEEGPGTVPMAATPPEGVPHQPAAADNDDSGTRPMPATPPGGIPTVIDDRADLEHDMDDDDSGTRPMTQTPSGGTRAAQERAGDAFAGEESSQEETLGETELSPGIPLPSRSEAPRQEDEAREEGLGPEEIESVVGMFGSPGGDEPEPAETAPATGDRPLEIPEPEPEAGEEPDEAAPGLDPSMEDAPTWIYEPSGVEAPRPARNRILTWGGIAAGVFAVGTVLTIVLGGGAGETVETPSDAAQVAALEGPPAVEVPRPSAEAGKGAPDAVEPVEPAPARAPEPPPAPARPPAPKPLASPGDGDILESGPFRDARDLMGRGRLPEAARAFEASLRKVSGLYTVQLALACRSETVSRALKSTGGAEEFFILPKEFNGRACYRLLWGAYQGRKAAERGRSSVPEAFLKDRNPPFVAPI